MTDVYALIDGDTVVEYPILNIMAKFPNTSFAPPITVDQLPDGVVPVVDGLSPIPGRFENVVQSGISVTEGLVTRNYALEPMNESEIASLTEATETSVRAQRNRLLAETDWTQVADAPVNRAAWAEYRQYLRNISAQQGFPFDIEWPTQPVTIAS